MRVRLPPDQHLDFGKMKHSTARNIQTGQSVAVQPRDAAVALNDPDVDRVADFSKRSSGRVGQRARTQQRPNPHLRMILHLMRSHSEGRIVSPSSLVASCGACPMPRPPANWQRVEAGWPDRPPRAHPHRKKAIPYTPAPTCLEGFSQLAEPHRPACTAVLWSGPGQHPKPTDYYFGGSLPARPRRHCPAARPARTAETVGGVCAFWCMATRPSWSSEGLKRQF